MTLGNIFTEKDFDLFWDMYAKQVRLDELMIKKKNNGEKPDPVQIRLALMDEIGEFIHELKPAWCWWKKERKKVNREALAEEWIDVLHFLFCKTHYTLHPDISVSEGTDNTLEINDIRELFIDTLHNIKFKLPEIDPEDGETNFFTALYLSWMVNPNLAESFAYFFLIAYGVLGANMKDIHELYCKKNQVNIDRANGDY